MMDGEIRSAFLSLDQDMTNQAQSITAQANREVGPYVNQNASTTTSHLRDFIRMNPSMFFLPKVNEDPKNFL